MAIEIDDTRREQLISRLQRFFGDEFDENISAFRAEQILDFAIRAVGPQVYNQAVQDAQKHLQKRLDDLDAEVYEPEI